jgi:hypothetical protein
MNVHFNHKSLRTVTGGGKGKKQGNGKEEKQKRGKVGQEMAENLRFPHFHPAIF